MRRELEMQCYIIVCWGVFSSFFILGTDKLIIEIVSYWVIGVCC